MHSRKFFQEVTLEYAYRGIKFFKANRKEKQKCQEEMGQDRVAELPAEAEAEAKEAAEAAGKAAGRQAPADSASAQTAAKETLINWGFHAMIRNAVSVGQ